MSTVEPVLKVEGLRTHLFTRWGTTRAVDDVSFELRRGETLGIVGESGSGKSMLALSLVRLTPEPAARILAGSVVLDGTDLLGLPEKRMRKLRGSAIAMILQDPHQSLNPVFTVGNQLAEAVHTHRPAMNGAAVRERVLDGLRKVRMPAPERRLEDYPHELSGGMKQRIVGAMAMSADPLVLIADEPTTALDVTTQAQYLRLLKELQRETDVGIILITHDFGVVAQTCDRVAVMYAGRIVEEAPVREIFDRPRHPYTRALLDSRPRRDTRVERLRSIEGSPPSLIDPPPGCRFAPRCPFVQERCEREYPDRVTVADGHVAACWRSGETLWPTR